MANRLGKHSEHLFAALCTSGGAVCNPATDDQHGWDHIVEIQPVLLPNLPPDNQPPLITALVQVKSTQRKHTLTKIKLSNSLKAVQSDLPCFLFLFCHFGPKYKIYGKHIWADSIDKILIRARQAERDGFHTLHKKSVNIRFRDADEIRDPSQLISWIMKTVGAVGINYSSRKSQLRKDAGYENGRYTGNLTLGPLRDLEQVADHEIGLLEYLPAKELAIFDERFGIRSIHPIFATKDGRIQLQTQGAKEAAIRVTGPDGKTLDVPAEVWFPVLIPEHEGFKVRVTGSFLDFSFSPRVSDERTFTLKYSHSAECNLHQHHQYYMFLHWCKAGPVSFQLISDLGTLIGGSININDNFGFRGITESYIFATLLVDIAGQVQSEKITITGGDLRKCLSVGFPSALLIQANHIKLCSSKFTDFRKIDRLAAFFVLTLGRWHFSAIVEFEITDIVEKDNMVEWKILFKRYVKRDAVSSHVGDLEKKVRQEFDQHFSTSNLSLLKLDDGNLTHFIDLNNKRGSVSYALNRSYD